MARPCMARKATETKQKTPQHYNKSRYTLVYFTRIPVPGFHATP